MLEAFIAGVLAGLGVVLPVGGAALLIVDIAVNRGFRRAAVGGLGVATGDGTYALLAAIAGGVVAALLAPWVVALQVAAVATLIVIGVQLLRSLAGSRDPDRVTASDLSHDLTAAEADSVPRIFFVFYRGTLAHPITLVTFLALIVGLAPTGTTPVEKAAFVTGVFVASMAWQLGWAAFGARRREQIPPQVRRRVLIVDGILLCGFILYIGLGLFR